MRSFLLAAAAIALAGCGLESQSETAQPRPASSSPAAQGADARAAAFDAYVKAAVEHGYFSGTVLVAKDGEPIFQKSYGMANYELNAPNTDETVYQFQSITKPFTALAIMMLQEEGALNVQDLMCDYVRDCPQAWRAITVHHLLTHTSGIEGFSRLADWDETLDSRTYWRGSAVNLVRGLPLLFNPGEGYRYSNTGYTLLAEVIERASGMTLAEFYRERIFSPIGMNNARFNNSRFLTPNLATGYYSLGTSFINVTPQTPTSSYGSAGLSGTAADLLLWDKALYADKLISRESYEQMIAHTENNYAYGWEVRNWFGRRQIGHAGSGFGFSSFIARFIDDRFTVIVLSNSDEASAGGVARALSAIYFGEEYAMPAPQPIAVLLDEIVKNGADAGIARYRALKAADPAAEDFQNDDLLVSAGYELYEAPLIDEAKRVFAFALEEFPQSAYSYDGLADIAIAEGQYETAIGHFETSLRMDPANDYAVQGLERARALIALGRQ